MEDLINTILSLKHSDQLKNLVINTVGKKSLNKQNVNILLLNTPCHGFGDIIFAIKIYNYLKEWYHCNVVIASTLPESFVKLKGNTDDLLKLHTSVNKECRRFKLLKLLNLDDTKHDTIYDLIFITPITSDFSISYQDVKQIVHYSNPFNTFFFSEYNGPQKNIDFPTGIGKHKMGLLLTKPKKLSKLPNLKNPYAVVYISDNIPNSKKCFINFIEMICKKYRNIIPKLDIIVPKYITDTEDYEKSIIKYCSKYYPTINTNVKHIISNTGINKNILTLRGDVYPLPNDKMLSLIKYSIDDILLTGDQSITDALSCCSHKNIFYQVAPWKENFGKSLSREMPQKYLVQKKTECGTIRAIKYNSDYSKFVKKWDFRKLAKPKIDNILNYSLIIKQSTELQALQKLILSSKTLNGLKNKLRNI